MAILQGLNGTGIMIVLVAHEADIARCAWRILHCVDGEAVEDEAVIDPIDARAAAIAGAPAGVPA